MADQEITVGNISYDKQTGMLQGFNINFELNVKPLHVDLQNYTPKDKNPEEIGEIRKEFITQYQTAIEKDPIDAKRYFTKIAEDFPNGISWQAPGVGVGADKDAGTLKMSGAPYHHGNLDEGAARQFMLLHGNAAVGEYKAGQTVMKSPESISNNLPGLAAAINQGDHFTDEQKSQLNSIMVSNLKQNGFYTEETQELAQQLDQSAQRDLG